jgi:septum formation topological specificity factor MinE
MQLRLFILQERDNSDSAYKDRLRLPLLQERLQHQQDRQRMKEIAVSGVIYVLYIGIYDIKVSIGELER